MGFWGPKDVWNLYYIYLYHIYLCLIYLPKTNITPENGWLEY